MTLGRATRLFVLALGITCAPASGGVAPANAAFANEPAQRLGWWIRVNAANQATHLYWRFGAEANRLGAPVAWVQGQDPDIVDVPIEQRVLDRVNLAALGMPPTVPVSFCVFFQDRGVA
jgi:hypothetical protein